MRPKRSQNHAATPNASHPADLPQSGYARSLGR